MNASAFFGAPPHAPSQSQQGPGGYPPHIPQQQQQRQSTNLTNNSHQQQSIQRSYSHESTSNSNNEFETIYGGGDNTNNMNNNINNNINNNTTATTNAASNTGVSTPMTAVSSGNSFFGTPSIDGTFNQMQSHPHQQHPQQGGSTSYSAANNNTNANFTMATASSGPENFSVPQQQYQQHQQQNEGEETFEYEGVALQTALNAFGNVASVAGNVVGGVRNVRGTLSGASTGSMGNVAQVAGGVMSSITPSNIAGSMTNWRGRIADVVAPVCNNDQEVLAQQNQQYQYQTDSKAKRPPLNILGQQQQQQQSSLSSSQSYRGRSNSYNSQQGSSIAAAQVFSAPSPTPPISTPIATGNNPNSTQELFRAPSPALSAVANSAQELFGSAPPTPTTASVLNLAASTNSMAVRIPNSNQQQQQQPQQMPPTSDNSWQMVQQKHQQSLVGDNASNFFGGAQTTATIAIQPPTSAEDNNANDFFNAPSPMMVSQPNSVEQLPPVALNISNNETINGNNTVNKGGDSNAGDHFNALSSSQQQQPVPVIVEQPQNKRAFSHRLSSMEKSIHDPTTFQYDETLNGAATIGTERNNNGDVRNDNNAVITETILNAPTMTSMDSNISAVNIAAGGSSSALNEMIAAPPATGGLTAMETGKYINGASIAPAMIDPQPDDSTPKTNQASTSTTTAVVSQPFATPSSQMSLPPPSNNKPTSTKILPPVRKLHLPIPKKANLPLPPPLPTRRKPLPTSSGSSSNTAKSAVSSTSPFRKPPPMGINSASPRFNVPGPMAHHSPRVSPRVITDSPIPSPRVDEVTTKKLNTPQLPPPSPRVVETATIMTTDSVTDNADTTPRTEEKTEMPSPLSQQVAEAATTAPPSAPSFNATLSATDDPRTTTTSSSLVQQRSIADDNDWNLVVNSVVSDAVEKAINNVAHTIPADASPSSEQQPLLVAPPEQQQKGPRYSAMAPPVYPNNEFPSTPSSRVTECDIMSDYQSHVHLEDYHVSTTTDNNDVDVPYSYTMEEEEGSAVPPNAASSITEDMLAVKEKEEELFQQSEVVETSSSSPESGVFIEKEAVGHPADDLGEMIESSTAISNDMTTYQALPTEVDTAAGDDQAQLKEEDLLVDEVPIADALPEGWIEAMDSSSGKLYYHNQVTHESSWDRPTCVVQEEEEEEDMCPSSSAPVDDPQEHPTELDYDHVGDHRVNKEEEKINNDQRQVDENKGVSEEPNEAEMPGSGVVDYLLPEGWVQALDEASGNVYYCNQTTGVTSWERPHEEEVAVNVIEETQEVIEETQEVIEEKHVQQPRMEESVHPTKEEMVSQQPEEDVAPQLETTESPPIQEPLLEGWMEITDEASGQVYYFNEVSGITQWDRPVAAENVAVEGQTAYVELLVQDDDAESREQQQEKDDASNEPSAGSEPFNEIEEPAANLSFESLPTGWIEAVDTSGKAYYYHEQTNESSWDRPVAQGEEEVSAAVNNADGAGSGEVAVVKQPPQLSSVEGTASIRSIENITLTSDSRARNSISEHGGSTAVNTIEGTTGSISMEEEQEHQLEEEEEEENVTSSKEQPEDACDESLPPGWAEASDPSSGKIYYYNSTSGTSAWDKPQPESKEEPTSTKSPEIGKSAEDHLVDGNTEEVDATEKTYQSDIQANVETEAIEEEVAKEVDVPDVSDSETAELDNIVEDNQWIETTDPSSGKTYYYNSNTGETSWTKPEPELESNENPLVVEVIGDSAEDESVTNGLVAKKESAEKLDEWTEVDHPINSDKCDVGEGEANRDVSSSPTSGLPQGWQKAIDPTSGNDYYFNEDTGETSWELPSTVHDDEVSKVASEEAKETVDSVTIKDDIEPKQLPLEHQCHSATEETAIQTVEQDDITMPSSKKDDPGPSVILQPWQEVTDPSSGRIYYFHETTGETSWDRPVVAEIIDRSSSVAPSGAHKYRPRPAHAIASFAFGGRLCVMIPQVAATLSGATTVPQEADKPPLRRGQVVIHRLCNLVPEEHEYSISPPEAPLLKTTEDTVLAYLHEKSSNPDNLLWNIITIAALNRGRLRNDKKVKKTIIDMLLSSSKSEKRSSKCGGQKQEDNVTSSPTASDLSEVQDLILRGERESAVCEALTQQNYGLALLLASMCDRTTYQITARRFADEVLQRGSPLHTATLLFSNNLELPKDEELLNPSTGHSFWNEHEYYGDLGETWREQLASILSNQTAGWERIVLALGDRLLQLGDCHGAHACYLVSYSTFGSPSNEGTRLVLLGCDHRIHMNRMLMTPQSIQSFERTEAFEWARRRGNRKTHIPSLQPFKLRYAELLADFGHEDLAREYLLSIRSCLGLNKKCDGKRGSTDIQFIDSLKMLDDRICGSTHAKPSSWESNDEAKGSLATVGSIVKSVLGKKQQPQQPKVEQVVPSSGNDAGLVVPEEPQLEGVVNDTPREVTELCMPQSSSFPTSSLYPPTQATDCGVVESSTFEGDESFVTTKLETTFEQISTSDAAIGDTPKSPVLSNPFSHNNMGNEDAAPSSAPPMFSLDQEPKQPKEEGKEKKKETILSTPSQAGNKNVNKKKAPVSEPPRSAGWLSKLLRRSDPDSKATVADVGEEMQAYYDEKLKRWIFPGDDPAEVAKPLAPPPIIPKTTDDTPSTPAPTAPASNDPLAALMAPPPSGVLSKKKTVGGTSSRYASTPLASNKLPPASPMIAPPTFATFQPKPSKSEPSKEETGP